MTTNDERLLRDERADDRTDVMPDGYREGADPDTTGVITSGHPERVSGEDDGVTGRHDTDSAWDRLAADFVDDPQRAVDEAVRLVREAVERSTATGGSGTEDLRTAFRRLRDLHRTLAAH